MEWKSNFGESFVEQGHVQAKREDLLKALDLRGLRPAEKQRAQVNASTGLSQLDRWFERSLTADSAADIFTD